MTRDTPVLSIAIVGAGLGGLAASIGLRRAGHNVTVFEKAPVLGEIGAGIQVPPNATRIFQEWGLLETLEALAEEPQMGIMRSYRGGEALSTVAMSQQYRMKFSTPYLMVHRVDLHHLLAQEAQRLGVDVRLGVEVVGVLGSRASFNQDQSQNDDEYGVQTQTHKHAQAHIQLSTGKHIPADIILGADGERSVCRASLLGHPTPLTDSGDHVFRITVPSTRVLQSDSDLARLVAPPAINLWVGPGGNALTYNLKRDGLFNVVLTQAHEVSASLPSPPELIPRPIAIEEVAREFEGWDPLFHRVLGLATSCARWTLLESESAGRWTNEEGNFALMGDAAHAMLPYLGQGAAMAFEDAAVLSVLFSSITNRHQIPSLLALYERIRKPRTVAMSRRSKLNREIFGMEDGSEQRERDRQLQEEEPFDGYANFLADPVLQKWTFGYDAFEEAERAVVDFLRDTEGGNGYGGVEPALVVA